MLKLIINDHKLDNTHNNKIKTKTHKKTIRNVATTRQLLQYFNKSRKHTKKCTQMSQNETKKENTTK